MNMIDANNIPLGYKDSPLGIIPEEWKVKRFSELFSFKNGINSDKGSYGKGIKFVNTMDVLNTQYLTHELIRGSLVISVDKMKEFNVQYGDILFNRTSETPNEIGYSTVYLDTNDVVFGGFIIRAKCVDHSIDHKFKMYCFKTDSIRKQIISFGNGAIRYNLGQEDLAKTQIHLPPLPEQQKIAEILSCWDEAIENQTRLIEKFEIRKRGLMQQLLTGKKRLGRFEGEWKKVKISNIGKVVTGSTPSMNKQEYYGDEYCWATAADFNGVKIENTAIKLSEKGKDVARIVPKGSVLVTCIASIGKNAIANIDIAFNQQINAIIPSRNFNSEFIYYMIEQSLNKLKEVAGAGAVPIINKTAFENVQLLFPTIKEQTVIAEILSTADEEIEKEKQKLSAFKLQKKGLMQQLLTGKKRVKLNIK